MVRGRFDGIIGHEAACRLLGRAFENGRLSHAYLFVGPEGVGKTTLANACIRALGCGEMDVTVVSRLTDDKTGKLKSAISVEQIRDLRERLGMSAMGGGRKAVLIESADRLQPAAANAFLKTLEEPRGDAVIILRASSAESVPATIASRCQVVRLPPVPRKAIADALAARGIGRAEAERTAALAMGRPGLALRLVQDGALRAERDIAAATLLDLVGRGIPERLKTIAGLLPKDETSAKGGSASGGNKAAVLEQTLDGWECVLRDLYLAAIGCPDLAVHALPAGAKGFGNARRWSQALKAVASARRASAHNASPQLALEHVALTF